MSGRWTQRAALAGLLILVALWGLQRYRTRDERQLRRLTRELFAAVQLDGAEPAVVAARRSRALVRFFVPELTITIRDAPTVTARAELISLAFQARTRLEYLRAELHGLEIEWDPGRDRARMLLAARLTARGRGEQGQGWREYEFDWIRTAEGWRCRAIREASTIERPVPATGGAVTGR
ncbi:MAG: nuclear transport factor 2 family protein [Candidatus Marinimicrobia bacterium]|nr:nuclear transport factor 2 family protein [Candidatus Neomarinimicrobiota bacterium]